MKDNTNQLTDDDLRNIALARTALASASLALLDISAAHMFTDHVSTQANALRLTLQQVLLQLDLQSADKFDADAQRALIASCERVLATHENKYERCTVFDCPGFGTHHGPMAY